MKQNIEINEYAGKILEALPKGVLLTTKAGRITVRSLLRISLNETSDKSS